MSADCYIARVRQNVYCGSRYLGGNAVAAEIREHCRGNNIPDRSDPDEPGFEVYLVDEAHARKIFKNICSETNYADRVGDEDFEKIVSQSGQLQFVIES